MKYEHKAIIDAATREGKLPMEKARELMGHDLLKAMVTTISGHAVAFKNMSEQQQDAAIQSMQAELAPAIDTAIRLISSQATKTVRMKLKKVAIGKKWQIVGEAEGDEEYLHELADKTQDQSDVLVLLYERDYLQGLDAIHGEKDQKSLPLDTAEPDKATGKAKSKPAGKAKSAADVAAAIAFKPEQLEKATAFVTEHRTPTTAGIQNILSVGYEKAEAILAELARQGVVVAQEDGKYAMPSLVGATDAASEPVVEGTSKPVGEAVSKLTDELYEKIKAKVIKDQTVSRMAIAVAFDLEVEVAEEAVDKLELEGVISSEGDMGEREVYDLPE